MDTINDEVKEQILDVFKNKSIWFKKFFTENNCFKYNQPWKYKGRSCTGYW